MFLIFKSINLHYLFEAFRPLPRAEKEIQPLKEIQPIISHAKGTKEPNKL